MQRDVESLQACTLTKANIIRTDHNRYTQGSILQYEPCVDRVIDHLYTRMESFCKTGQTTDMATWLKRYTFDVGQYSSIGSAITDTTQSAKSTTVEKEALE